MSPAVAVPSHIPPDRVVPFDVFGAVQPGEDSQTFWIRARDAAPDVFYTPLNGGHWVATRAREIERIQLDHEVFSHEVVSLPRETNLQLYPLTLDPPRHGPFRRLINPAFTPRAVGALEAHARGVTRRLIGTLAPLGRCEFIEEFARVLPIEVFMSMVDLPGNDTPQLLHWTETVTRSGDVAERHNAYISMVGYLGGKLAERAACPGDDLLSQIVTGEVEGRPLTPEETMNVCVLLLFGGLDTVASMLGFVARFLALNPEHRRALVADPSLVPQAIEELLRRHGIANTARLIRRDVELDGVTLHADEIVLAPNVLVGLDDRVVDDPMTVDFARAPIHMGTFGKGPHLCPGAILARREIKVFLEEWLARIPDFEIAPGTVPVIEAGLVAGVIKLELSWRV